MSSRVGRHLHDGQRMREKSLSMSSSKRLGTKRSLPAYEPDDKWQRSQRKREKVNQHGENPTYLIVTGPFARAEA